MSEAIPSSNQQLLVLKVMRLARPKLSPASNVCLDPVDPSGFSQLIGSVVSARNGEENHDSALGEYLIAPQMFDNIYLGETFTFYVNCVNESDQKVGDVCVKCELQTNSQRVALPCSLTDQPLAAGEASGQVISHEVKELGQHILICSVNYKTASDEKMYFRKFFKFPVSKPIDVKTKFYNAEDSSNNDVYLEAQIENTSAGIMVVDNVDLEPSQHYNVLAILAILPEEDISVCSNALRPNDVRQFLFCLSPKDPQRLASYKDMTVIGKLDMSWRTSMGERGRLQTSALQRIAPGYGDIRLVVDKVPSSARVRQPFEVLCKIHNCSERALDLTLSLLPPSLSPPSFVFCSLSGQSLGQVPPNGSIPFSVEILPVTTGFQSISGFRLYDSNLKRTYEHDDIAQVFVM